MASEAAAERWRQRQRGNSSVCMRVVAAAQSQRQGGRASAAARRQQGSVSGRRAAAPAWQRRGDGGAEAAAGRWPQRQNDKVSGRAREAAAQGGVSGGSAVAAFLLRCGVGSNYYYDT